MPGPTVSPDDAARSLVAIHRLRARQIVVDRIIACVREHDIFGAKAWDEVGRKIDEMLCEEIAEHRQLEE